MVKAIFFDFDGTFFSHKSGEISASTRTALAELRKRNIRSVLATGRHMLEMEELPVNDLSFDGYITLNGQLCLDEKKKLFLGKTIEGAEKEYLLHLFHEKKIPVMFIEENRMYINFVNEVVEKVQADILTEIPEAGAYTGNDIYMAVAYGILDGDIQKEKLEKQLGGCKITRWHTQALDIISSSGGKIAGIQEYLNKNNFTWDEVMAFGDAENDLEMLQSAKVGVAMGNAAENVKAHADYVTDDVDSGGIEKALRYYKII